MNTEIKTSCEEFVLGMIEAAKTTEWATSDPDRMKYDTRLVADLMQIQHEIEKSERAQLQMDLDQIFRTKQVELDLEKLEAEERYRKAQFELETKKLDVEMAKWQAEIQRKMEETAQKKEETKKLIIIDLAGRAVNYLFGMGTLRGMRRAQQEGLILPKNEIDTYNRTFFQRWR